MAADINRAVNKDEIFAVFYDGLAVFYLVFAEWNDCNVIDLLSLFFRVIAANVGRQHAKKPGLMAGLVVDSERIAVKTVMWNKKRKQAHLSSSVGGPLADRSSLCKRLSDFSEVVYIFGEDTLRSLPPHFA